MHAALLRGAHTYGVRYIRACPLLCRPQDLAAQAQLEAYEMSRQFTANPLPKSTMEPRFCTLNPKVFSTPARDSRPQIRRTQNFEIITPCNASTSESSTDKAWLGRVAASRAAERHYPSTGCDREAEEALVPPEHAVAAAAAAALQV